MNARIALGPLVFAAAGICSVVLAAGALPQASASKEKALAIIRGSDCFSCHAVDHKIVGPAFTAVAEKFAGRPDAETTLVEAVKRGHVGTWGTVPMPPHPKLGEAQIRRIVAWILTLKPQKASAPAAPGKTYSYKVNGKTETTEFPIFKPGGKKVTAAVFRGYELFNSYCFRCHGEDAVGGEYAPDLRRSLDNGMTQQQFLTFSMEGNKAKGMPAWAGFFTPHEIKVIYQYVKARAIGAVAEGIPPE
jgi:cytochrome c